MVEAEAYRLQGEMLAAVGSQPEAEVCIQRALAVAREQSARIWELRAGATLARLWRDQGKRTEGPRPARADLRLVHRKASTRRSLRRRRRCWSSSRSDAPACATWRRMSALGHVLTFQTGHHGNLSNWGRPSHISSQGAFEPTKI